MHVFTSKRFKPNARWLLLYIADIFMRGLILLKLRGRGVVKIYFAEILKYHIRYVRFPSKTSSN